MIFEAKILEMFDVERLDITFSTIRAWILKRYGVIVSNSSISQVKEKCGLDEFKLDMKIECECENLTEKEQYVLMALKHFKVINLALYRQQQIVVNVLANYSKIDKRFVKLATFLKKSGAG